MSAYTRQVTVRMDLNLFKDVIDYAAKQNITQTDAIHILLNEAMKGTPKKVAEAIERAEKEQAKSILIKLKAMGLSTSKLETLSNHILKRK